jgi:oligoribonuclease
MMIWVDVETTGLDSLNDWLLEVGIVITEDGPEFEEVGRKNWVMAYDQNAAPFIKIPDVVMQMHTDSGLWDACKRSDNTSFDLVDCEIADFINGAAGSPMAGATVHFDRAFLKEFLPRVEKLFHYRNFDVSTLKMVGLMYDDMYYWADRAIHRALPDLEDSIENARNFCRRYES